MTAINAGLVLAPKSIDAQQDVRAIASIAMNATRLARSCPRYTKLSRAGYGWNCRCSLEFC